MISTARHEAARIARSVFRWPYRHLGYHGTGAFSQSGAGVIRLGSQYLEGRPGADLMSGHDDPDRLIDDRLGPGGVRYVFGFVPAFGQAYRQRDRPTRLM